MPFATARDYFVENMGRQFDPGCVDAFLSRWDEVTAIATGQALSPFSKFDASRAVEPV